MVEDDASLGADSDDEDDEDYVDGASSPLTLRCVTPPTRTAGPPRPSVATATATTAGRGGDGVGDGADVGDDRPASATARRGGADGDQRPPGRRRRQRRRRRAADAEGDPPWTRMREQTGGRGGGAANALKEMLGALTRRDDCGGGVGGRLRCRGLAATGRVSGARTRRCSAAPRVKLERGGWGVGRSGSAARRSRASYAVLPRCGSRARTGRSRQGDPWAAPKASHR